MTTQTLRLARMANMLWLFWTLAGLAGVVGGLAIKTAIEIAADIGGYSATLEAIPPVLFGTLLGTMLGICTSVAQWLVLRRRQAGFGAWVPATFVAYVVFWTVHNSGLLPFWVSPWGLVVQGFVHGAIVGATFGAAQWLVLRRHIADARRWVLISAIGWSLAGALTHFLLRIVFAAADLHGPFDVLGVSVFAALFSGIALGYLLDEPSRQ